MLSARKKQVEDQQQPVVAEDEEDEGEEEDEEDDEDEDEDEDGEFIDPMANVIAGLLSTEDGDTVCTALVKIANQLEIQNKIMVKILSTLKK